MKSCFLCGWEIDKKRSREHIFGDAFLERFLLKEKKINFANNRTAEYSRIRVSAHPECNSGVGSRFEEAILDVIDNIEHNLDVMSELHSSDPDSVVVAIRERLSMWLCKLYHGLSYWELYRENHPDREYQALVGKALETDLFRYMQRCFSNEYAFYCPSSLYYFNIPDADGSSVEFDFATRHEVGGAYIKFGNHLLVVVLGDGYLTQHYLNSSIYDTLQRHIANTSAKDPLAYLLAVSHVWAVRENLPIEPELVFEDDCIKDVTRLGRAVAPEISDPGIQQSVAEIYGALSERFRPKEKFEYPPFKEVT